MVNRIAFSFLLLLLAADLLGAERHPQEVEMAADGEVVTEKPRYDKGRAGILGGVTYPAQTMASPIFTLTGGASRTMGRFDHFSWSLGAQVHWNYQITISSGATPSSSTSITLLQGEGALQELFGSGLYLGARTGPALLSASSSNGSGSNFSFGIGWVAGPMAGYDLRLGSSRVCLSAEVALPIILGSFGYSNTSGSGAATSSGSTVLFTATGGLRMLF